MEVTWSHREAIGQRGEALYEQKIRAVVENEANIGKMVIIDVETGDYEVAKHGLGPARDLQSHHPNTALYGKRIGYDVAKALGGVLRRTAP